VGKENQKKRLHKNYQRIATYILQNVSSNPSQGIQSILFIVVPIKNNKLDFLDQFFTNCKKNSEKQKEIL
jgi:hypothetical protein